MCNCKNVTNDKFKEMYPDAESIYGQYEMLSGRAYSVVTIKLPNKKKPIEKLLLHSYCPTCGQKYE
jgi:ribosomal protein L33